jgi:hypothetical protein
MSYGTNTTDAWRQAGTYTGRIVLNNQVEDFATALDRRIARARELRMLPSPVVEHHPSELKPNGFRRRF